MSTERRTIMGRRNYKTTRDEAKGTTADRDLTGGSDRQSSQGGKSSKSNRNTSDKRRESAGSQAGYEISNPNMYFTDQVLLDQASQFSFSNYLGESVPLNSNETVSEYVAGLMTISLNPCPGWTDKETPMTSGINMQAYKIYSLLSSRNAKTTGYAPQDVTVLMLALGEVISLSEHIRRTFGLTFIVNKRNRMYPRTVIQTVGGVNVDNLFNSLAQYRLKFNTIINMVNKIPFLSNITYFERCALLYRNIYLDSPSTMAQSIALVPQTTWLFDEAYSSEGSGLRTQQVSVPTGTMESQLTLLNSMVNALLTSTTFNYIYSDILNYVEKSSGATLITLPFLAEDYGVIPVYVPSVLEQFHNMSIIGMPLAVPNPLTSGDNTRSNDVECDVDKNVVLYRPQWSFKTPCAFMNLYVDMLEDNPTVVNRIDATRFAVRMPANYFHDTLYYTMDVSLPDHYVVSVKVYDASESFSPTLVMSQPSVSAGDPADMFAVGREAVCLSKFSNAVIRYVYTMDTDPEFMGSFGDLTFYTTLDFRYLRTVNNLVFMGLFELR